jgi:hypothetical protein
MRCISCFLLDTSAEAAKLGGGVYNNGEVLFHLAVALEVCVLLFNTVHVIMKYSFRHLPSSLLPSIRNNATTNATIFYPHPNAHANPATWRNGGV